MYEDRLLPPANMPCSKSSCRANSISHRWRRADIEKPHEMARHRRRHRRSTRLVPRSSDCLFLHQPGRGQHSLESFPTHDTRLPNHRAPEYHLPGELLSPASAVAGELHRRGGTKRHHPSHRDGAAWRRAVQCECRPRKPMWR